MIRLSMRKNGQRIVVLGLEPENLRRLQMGEPVRVNLRHLIPGAAPTGLPDIDVMVAATDTDDWRGFAAKHGITDLPRMPSPKVCQIPDCGCTGEAHT